MQKHKEQSRLDRLRRSPNKSGRPPAMAASRCIWPLDDTKGLTLTAENANLSRAMEEPERANEVNISKKGRLSLEHPGNPISM